MELSKLEHLKDERHYGSYNEQAQVRWVGVQDGGRDEGGRSACSSIISRNYSSLPIPSSPSLSLCPSLSFHPQHSLAQVFQQVVSDVNQHVQRFVLNEATRIVQNFRMHMDNIGLGATEEGRERERERDRERERMRETG